MPSTLPSVRETAHDHVEWTPNSIGMGSVLGFYIPSKKLGLRKPFLPSPKGFPRAELGEGMRWGVEAALPADLWAHLYQEERSLSVCSWEPERSRSTV